MSNRTSHRRRNFKPRDPMALALEEEEFHQRVIKDKKKAEKKARVNHDAEWYEEDD